MALLPRLLAVIVLGAACPALAAQCVPIWSSGGPRADLIGAGRCSTQWDPDGAGPLPLRLVIGGDQLTGGSQPPRQFVMTWDGSQWLALGSGPGTTGHVYALTTWNGLLVAGGDFTGPGVARIALWNGSSWQQIGSGFPTTVLALTEWNGLLVAAGYTSSSGVHTAQIRTWNGVSWTALPTPPQLEDPLALVSYQGLLCVGGLRPSTTLGVLERWNGTSWATSITASSRITSFAVRPSIAVGISPILYVGGWFNNIGGTSNAHIASTTGGTSFAFNAVGSLGYSCSDLSVRNVGLSSYRVVALTSNPAGSVMQFTGTSWTGMGDGSLNSLEYFGGSYHAACYPSATTSACRRYDGSTWVDVRGPGIDGEVRAAARIGDDMLVGGTFTTDGVATLNRIARWNGTTLTPFGTGITGTSVDALTTLVNGDVVAAGLFSAVDGTGALNIARWNGSSWSNFGLGINNQVLALVQMPNGDLIAGGKFSVAGGVPSQRIARWNGTTWSPLGSGMNGDVAALAVRGDGVLFAGGTFTVAGGVSCNRVAQWNGTQWLNVGAGCNADVLGLAARPNGDVVAVGAFTSAGGLPADRCARWTGTSWAAMGGTASGSLPVRAIAVLPDGDIVVGHGYHTSGSPDDGISRWNGTSWSGFGVGLAEALGVQPVVQTIAQRRTGELVLGGVFDLADGLVSKNLAQIGSTCLPLATPYGVGCSSVAGPLVLAADTLPWIGALFRTTTTGVAANSLCLGALGFTQLSFPLDQLLGEGQPGCSLLTTLDILLVLTPGPGTAHSAFAFNDDPALIGVRFFQQTLPLEFDALGAMVAVRGSDALDLTIGTL